MTSDADSLRALVHAKIENLRPKLLDLSRRNPLISTKLGPRSNSHVRFVDELPDVLFFRLNNAQEMSIIPLPPIEEDPRDEQTPAFRRALINARITDDSFLAAMEAVDRDADDYLEKTRTIERALKDKVRAQLGLWNADIECDLKCHEFKRVDAVIAAVIFYSDGLFFGLYVLGEAGVFRSFGAAER